MARPDGRLPVRIVSLTSNDRFLTCVTVGTDYGAAEGGLDNAKSFFQNGFCALIDWGFNAFYFEAFDEPWKPASIGDNGKAADETTWGAMTADRKAKFALKC